METNTYEKAGLFITLDEAKNMNSAFKAKYPDFTQSILFDKELLFTLLNQEGCDKVRVYFGAFEEEESKILKEAVIFVGADAHANDMAGSLILDRGVVCPSMCKGSKIID
ncbi:MAG: hypothetical protein CFE24_08950 [Flavobacterium sp. BFFFF2]|nr:MAG: hypothetical protein CFE24_08950 [Flavobacterium sp. BFFFF2]